MPLIILSSIGECREYFDFDGGVEDGEWLELLGRREREIVVERDGSEEDRGIDDWIGINCIA